MLALKITLLDLQNSLENFKDTKIIKNEFFFLQNRF